MPRAFLITNRRYELTPPPPHDPVLALVPASFGYVFPAHDVQEEAQDLTVPKKRPLDQVSESKVPADTSCPDTDDVTHLNLQHDGLKSLLSPPTSVTGSCGTDSVASISPSGSDACGLNLLTGDSHVCLECGKRYSTSSNLARHRQTHRSVTDKKARKCPHCDKVYVSMPAFSMHVRTHSQGCQCRFCGKCFSRPWLLQGHIRTHTGEKPFKCHICSKAFADKSNLRAHVQTHSSSKPYVCERCGKAFALKSYLYKHEESSCMRMHRRENHHHRRRSANTNIGLHEAEEEDDDEAEMDGTQEMISHNSSSSSSSGSPSSPSSPPATPSPAQFMHPRKAFVLQYNASLLQLQSLQTQSSPS